MRRSLLVSVNSPIIKSGETPSYSISYSGFAPGEDASFLSTLATVSDNAPTGYAVPGLYTVSLSGALAADYDIIYNFGSLKVKPLMPEAVIYSSNNVVSDTSGPMGPVQQGSEGQFMSVLGYGQSVPEAIKKASNGTLLFISPQVANFYGFQSWQISSLSNKLPF
jgi:hypothetical protein